MSRQLVVVDCETTGLHENAALLEIAAVNVDSGKELRFVPHVERGTLAAAQPDALRINCYYERGVYRDMLTESETALHYLYLQEMLNGNTFAGSNPTFDSRLIQHQEARISAMSGTTRRIGQVWHHRLADLAAYTAGVLALPPTDLPGLDKVCEWLGVDIEERHSALGDARATAECFRALRQLATDPRVAL